jgi:hypothetical protein
MSSTDPRKATPVELDGADAVFDQEHQNLCDFRYEDVAAKTEELKNEFKDRLKAASLPFESDLARREAILTWTNTGYF